VLTINANGVGPKIRPPARRKRDISAIVGGIIGGVAAIFAVIGVVFFVKRQRRQAAKSVLSSPTDSREAGFHAIVTPFAPNLNSPEGTRESQDTEIPPEQQQPSVDENPDTEMVAPRRLSSFPPTVFPLPLPVVPVPVGLSDKEIARLRAQTLGSRQSQTHATLNVSQPEITTSPAIADTESGEAPSTYDTRRLHTEVESLRREMERLRDMERLRVERLVAEAPPSYTEGDR
jgi:hypothetical protein